jgi:hypothetical protein
MQKIAHHRDMAKLALKRARRAISQSEIVRHLNAHTRHKRIALNLALYGIEV